MGYSTQARMNMVTNQLEPSGVTSDKLINALETVPRELFVPEDFSASAYLDEDIPLGSGRYLMEPRVFARLLQAADIRPLSRVLDIACASGYSSAVLAQLTDKLVAIESVSELAEMARRNLKQLHCDVDLFNASIIDGYTLKAPYDVIFINGAIESAPAMLLEQLAEGGRVFGIIKENNSGVAAKWTRAGKHLHQENLFDANVPLLPDFVAKKEFIF